jgi:tetratricopeptide (TPR) repeat protein
MLRRRASIYFTIALSATLFATDSALPAMSGGGGSGPTASAPQYDPKVDYQKGVDAYQAQDFKSAVSAFKRVAAGVPRFAPAQYLLGASYMQMGDYKKAKRPLELAVKYDAELIDARRDLGVTYAKLGDAAKAASQRDALAALKTACAAPCANSARIDAAVQMVEAAMAGTPQASPPPQALNSTGSGAAAYVSAVGLINEGLYQAAISELEVALWSTGPDPDLMTYLGFANRKLKRFDAARRWYEAALATAPNHRGALEYYGELKLELGDVRGARAHLARLDALCGFGCQQADELRRWIREAVQSAS